MSTHALHAAMRRAAPVREDNPPLTDLGNAERLVARHGHELRYVPAWKCYLVWDGRRWARDVTGEVVRRAKDTVRQIYSEARELPDGADRKAVAAHAVRSESEARIRAMVSLARTEAGIPVAPDDLDTDPWVLNVLNGTIDLRTGELRPHNPLDLITKLAPVYYDPDATSPLLDSFLERIMDGSAELIDYLQRLIGYAITGSTGEQIFALLWGAGANGKSTLLEVLRRMLGDYAQHAPTETLMARKGGGVPNDVARLQGARFVSAVETEAGRSLAEALVKQLTGGDTITARYLYGEFFEFRPIFKLFLAANHRPRIRGTDYAIWRRVRLIPFTVSIPPEERDPELVEKLAAEMPGILTWAVLGCLRWQREGLEAPPEVLAATDEYRADMDPVAGFIAECCELRPDDPDAATPATELYAAYTEWAEATGAEVRSATAFGRELTDRGLATDRRGPNRSTRRLGIVLSDENGQSSANRVHAPNPHHDNELHDKTVDGRTQLPEYFQELSHNPTHEGLPRPTVSTVSNDEGGGPQGIAAKQDKGRTQLGDNPVSRHTVEKCRSCGAGLHHTDEGGLCFSCRRYMGVA